MDYQRTNSTGARMVPKRNLIWFGVMWEHARGTLAFPMLSSWPWWVMKARP